MVLPPSVKAMDLLGYIESPRLAELDVFFDGNLAPLEGNCTAVGSLHLNKRFTGSNKTGRVPARAKCDREPAFHDIGVVFR
jgi:hypothetical protein